MQQQILGAKGKSASSPSPDLGMEVASAVARVYRRLRSERADDQVGDTHFAVLAFLVKNGPHSLKDLSIRERVTPPSMNQTVNALEAAGYVERRGDPQDRRRVLIAATHPGISMAGKTRRLRHAWLNARLRELTPQERESLAEAARILRTLADS